MTRKLTPKQHNFLVEAFGDGDPTDLTKLHPDLRAALKQGPFGLMIHHPLVVEVFPVWKMCNRVYEMKLEQIARYLKAGDYGQAIWLHERPYRLVKLAEYREKMPTDKFRDLLMNIWTDIEFPHQFDDLPYRLFKQAGYVSDSADDPRKDGLRVYRGVSNESHDFEYADGLSWTLDHAKARWFANRYTKKEDPRAVYTGIVDYADVLAYLTGRGESEIVAGQVHDIKVLERVLR